MRLRKLLIMALVFALTLSAAPLSVSADGDDPQASPPISHGKVNKPTYVYWGKNEVFPTLAFVFPPQEFDVFEYDENWVLVTCEAGVTYRNDFSLVTFYGYIKRSDITCDPELKGSKSPPAKKGQPGKRAKKPKKKEAEPAGESASAPTAPPTPPPQPTEVPVEQLEEYDWIVRTPGMLQKTVNTKDGIPVNYRFSLMGEKFGGVAASSAPQFNNGKRNPYAAVGYFSMEIDMQAVINIMGGASQYMGGTGGVTNEGTASGAKMYLDTGADDFALVNFALNFNMKGTADPTIDADNGSAQIHASVDFKADSISAVNMQLKKAGTGYRIILKGVGPEKIDLDFPAILERFPSDQDNRDAQDADKRRKAAEDKINKQLEEMRKAEQKAAEKNADPLDGVSLDDPLDGASLDDPLDGASLVDPLDGVSLVPQSGDTAANFPG